MAAGIAVRDILGITHWAPFSEKGGRANDAGRHIRKAFERPGPPNLSLACEGWQNPTPKVKQVKCVATLVSRVTCMACLTQL